MVENDVLIFLSIATPILINQKFKSRPRLPLDPFNHSVLLHVPLNVFFESHLELGPRPLIPQAKPKSIKGIIRIIWEILLLVSHCLHG